MGIAELMAVLSILFGTLAGGIYGAFYAAILPPVFGVANVDINLQGFGHVANTGFVFGTIMGAILGFVFSSSVAGSIFFFRPN